MRCKHAEKLIMDSQEIDLQEDKKQELNNHIQSCHICSNFVNNLNSIRDKTKMLPNVEPSDLLVQKTLEYCHAELSQKNHKASIFSQSKIPTPKFIWAAIIAIITISLIWFFPILKDFFVSDIISKQTVWIFSIIIQNSIMLLFAPLIIKKLKIKQQIYNHSYSI